MAVKYRYINKKDRRASTHNVTEVPIESIEQMAVAIYATQIKDRVSGCRPLEPRIFHEGDDTIVLIDYDGEFKTKGRGVSVNCNPTFEVTYDD